MIDDDRDSIDWTTRDRRRIRLPQAAYAEQGSSWHVTLAVRQDIPSPFVGDKWCGEVVQIMLERCQKRGCLLHLVCVTPDHIHLLLEVRDSDLVAVIGDVKSCIARVWWTHGGVGSPWQRRFYDRGVRTSQQFDETVRYILDNPVKAELAATWEEYPYIAGLVVSP